MLKINIIYLILYILTVNGRNESVEGWSLLTAVTMTDTSPTCLGEEICCYIDLLYMY